MRSQRVFPAVIEGHSWELYSFGTVMREQRLILLTIDYTSLARPLESDYYPRATLIS